MKVTVIMEKASDGYYSCFVEEDLPGFGLAGYGDTAEDAKADMLKAYEDIKEMKVAAGMNPSLMRQYTSGVTAAGQKQYDKIRMAVERIGKELSSATF